MIIPWLVSEKSTVEQDPLSVAESPIMDFPLTVGAGVPEKVVPELVKTQRSNSKARYMILEGRLR